VVSAEKGVDVSAGEPEEELAMAKPGQKIWQLKKELQQQIARRKAEEWARRLHEQHLDDEEEGEVEHGGI
jgi:hypothetical protein